MMSILLGTVASSAIIAASTPDVSISLFVSSAITSVDLVDFPWMVNMANLPSEFWDNVSATGGNIRLYDSDGTTPIPFDITTFDYANQTGRMFVKKTISASSNSECRIILGSTTDLLPVGDTYGRNAMWSDYEVVWVFPEVDNRTGKHTQDSGAVAATPLGTGYNSDWRTIDTTQLMATMDTAIIVWSGAVSVNMVQEKQGTFIGVSRGASNRSSLMFDAGPNHLDIYNTSNSWIHPTDANSNYMSINENHRIGFSQNGASGRSLWDAGIQTDTTGSVTARPSAAGNTDFTLNTSSSAFGERSKAQFQYAWFRGEHMNADWMKVDAEMMAENSTSVQAVVTGATFPITMDRVKTFAVMAPALGHISVARSKTFVLHGDITNGVTIGRSKTFVILE